MAKPTKGTAIPRVPHMAASLHQGVSKPLPVSPLYSTSCAANRCHGLTENDSIHRPGLTRPAHGTSLNFMSPRVRICALISRGSGLLPSAAANTGVLLGLSFGDGAVFARPFNGLPITAGTTATCGATAGEVAGGASRRILDRNELSIVSWPHSISQYKNTGRSWLRSAFKSRAVAQANEIGR